MKYIQTFWPGPKSGTPDGLFGLTGGWLSAEYHWMSWALSALQARKVFGEVELITTSAGKEMLCGVLELPYARVSTALDEMPAGYPEGLWSMAKLYSYQLQREPFLHLDGDVIFWERPSDEWLRSPLLCQNIEKDLFFYRATLERISETFSYLPAPFARECYAGRDIYSCNAGLFGGSAIGLIQEYCGMAFDFLERNRGQLERVSAGDLNFIYEQYLYCWLARERGMAVAAFLPEIVEDPLYDGLIRWQAIPPAPLIHPVGGFKKLQWVCNSLAKRMREEYPDDYYRIIGVMQKEGVPLNSKVYSTQVNRVDGPEGYERTAEAMRYLSGKYGNWTESDLNEQERECLSEISRLETTIVEHGRVLFGDRMLVDEQYTKDIRQFRETRNFFSGNRKEQESCLIRFNPDAVLITVHRRWVNDKSNRLEDIITLNFNSGEEGDKLVSGCAAVVPAVLQLAATEYYLDELDALIVEICREPISIGDILREIEEYFDADDLAADYGAYEGLIKDCLKRLFFAGVLVTSDD